MGEAQSRLILLVAVDESAMLNNVLFFLPPAGSLVKGDFAGGRT